MVKVKAQAKSSVLGCLCMATMPNTSYIVRSGPGVIKLYDTYAAAFERFKECTKSSFHDVELYCVVDDTYTLEQYHIGKHIRILMEMEDKIRLCNSVFADMYLTDDKHGNAQRRIMYRN